MLQALRTELPDERFVYVADSGIHAIRKITPAGVVNTLAGGSGTTDGTGTSASFYNPKDAAVDGSGNLYVVDRADHTIRKGTLQSVPLAVINASISATPASGTAPLTVQFTGTGSSTVYSDVLSYLWTFGDGSTSTEKNRSQTYMAAGTYSVTLAVSNTTGQDVSASAQSITVSTGTSTLIADADKVFVWAEKTYASIFFLAVRKRPRRLRATVIAVMPTVISWPSTTPGRRACTTLAS